jgi:putative nucleotidyltransferase with HDIG domain
MLKAGEKLRLCELYQLLPGPNTTSHGRARTDGGGNSSDARSPAEHFAPLRGTTAAAILYPFWGIFKVKTIILRRFDRVSLYGIALVAAGLSLLGSLLAAGFGLEGPGWQLALLGAFALWAERHHVRITSNAEMTVSVLPVLFAAVVFGPIDAMVVGAVGLLGDFRSPYLRWVIWTAMRTLAAGLAGLVASSVLSQGEAFGVLVLAVALAALVEALCDAFLGAATVSIRGSGSARGFLSSMHPIMTATVPLYTPLIALLAYAYNELAVWSVLFFFGPVFAAQRFYRLYQEEREAARQLEKANLSFAAALVAALDARDRYTAGHSAAVAVYARDIAERIGLSQDEQQLAHLAGLVHDIGKVGLPPGLLEKPGPLTLEERRIMEEHSAIGETILGKVEGYAEIATIVRHHHERVDGNGYPDGLEGKDIPLISKIIGVADAYNAMTSGRPYRDAMPSRVARLRLAQAVGSQFDTTIVAAFEAILAEASEMYLSGVRADFAVEAQRQPGFTPDLVTSAA